MEINTQHMEALLRMQEQQARLPRKNPGSATGFEAILEQQITQGKQAEQPQLNSVQPGLYDVLLEPAAKPEELDPDSAVLMAAFEQASGTLDLWDSYAKTLGASTTSSSLRDAWSVLEGIDGELAKMQPAKGKDASLDAILNELEVMAATEKFKFNRGDYNT